jgi:hypothetical protein
MEWALIDGKRGKAEKSGQIGICPGCNGEVRAKCGEIVSWHWAHISADCDPWSEPETEWHRKWKGYFPPDWQEVTKPPHRADVAGPDGVLEIQRSGISPEEIREREQFYGRMAWLINGHDFWENLEWIKVAGDYYEFRWKHARKTWITANKPIFIDTPFGLFKVKNIRDGKWKVACGSFVQAAKLPKSLDSSGKTVANMDLHLYDAMTESQRSAFIKKGRDLICLYESYVAKSKEAWPGIENNWLIDERRIIPPDWSANLTIYGWLSEANAEWVKKVIADYSKGLAEAEAEIDRKSQIEKIKRQQLIKDFLQIRKAPPEGFDSFDTDFIEQCIKSLYEARNRSPQYFGQRP